MKIVIYSLNDVVTKFIYWKKIVIDTLNDTQKKIPQNHTQILYYKKLPSKMMNIYTPTTESYTNFVLQKLPLKDGEKHIYIYIVHSTCNIVTIRFKGREGGLKHPYKIS